MSARAFEHDPAWKLLRRQMRQQLRMGPPRYRWSVADHMVCWGIPFVAVVLQLLALGVIR